MSDHSGDGVSSGARLHFYTVVRRAFDVVRHAAFPIVLILVGTWGAERRELVVLIVVGIAVGLFVLGLAGSYVWWRRFTYQLSGEGLFLRWGIFVRKERFLSPVRVQRIATKAGPVMRALGVVTLHIETAGGSGEPEVDLPAITEAAAADIRRRLEAERTAGAGAGATAGAPSGATAAGTGQHGAAPGAGEFAAGRPSQGTAAAGPRGTPPEATRGKAPRAFVLGFRELLVAGMTSGGVLGAMALVFGLYYEAQQVGPWIEELVHWLFALFGGGVAAYAGLFGMLLVLGWIVSTAGHVEAFWRFTVRRDGDRLLTTRGLMARRTAELEVHRVHSVVVNEGIVRGLLGRATVKVGVAGQSTTEGAHGTKLLPIVRAADVPQVLATVLPEYTYPLDELERAEHRVPSRARLPYALRGLVWTAPPAIVAAVLLSLPLLGALALAGPVWLLFCRREGAACVTPELFAVRRRIGARRTFLVGRRHVQAFERARSPLDTSLGLATTKILAVTPTVHARLPGMAFEQVTELEEAFRDGLGAPAPAGLGGRTRWA